MLEMYEIVALKQKYLNRQCLYIIGIIIEGTIELDIIRKWDDLFVNIQHCQLKRFCWKFRKNLIFI